MLLQQGASENTPILEVWAKLLGVAETKPNRKPALVSERLRWIHFELEHVAKQMGEAGYREYLYSNTISNIEYAISPMILAGEWKQAKQYLGSDTLLAMAFCSEILPNEESQISSDELTQIKGLVDELCSSLSGSELPSRLIRLIEHHIDLIQRALAEYPITGARAFRKAARTGLGELIEVKEEVSEVSKTNHKSREIIKLGAVWKKLNEVSDAALKTEKLVQLGQNAWKVLENYL